MLAFWIGSLAFVLYFLYDANSIVWRNPWLQKCFGLGTVLLFGATCGAVWQHWVPGMTVGQWVGAILSVFFFLLLIYTLFFALPFRETYVTENRKREVYTKGVYGLCRHPGMLWLTGLYVSLWAFTGSFAGGYFFLAVIWYDFLYVVYQDFWVFPNTFYHYMEYRQNTPFLLPTFASVKHCFVTLGK